jgi:hypothetical protein
VSHTVAETKQFKTAIRLIDEQNSADPTLVEEKGALTPRELLNARRLTDWVTRLAPDASEALHLAARSQHICRWQKPRSEIFTRKNPANCSNRPVTPRP